MPASSTIAQYQSSISSMRGQITAAKDDLEALRQRRERLVEGKAQVAVANQDFSDTASRERERTEGICAVKTLLAFTHGLYMRLLLSDIRYGLAAESFQQILSDIDQRIDEVDDEIAGVNRRIRALDDSIGDLNRQIYLLSRGM